MGLFNWFSSKESVQPTRPQTIDPVIAFREEQEHMAFRHREAEARRKEESDRREAEERALYDPIRGEIEQFGQWLMELAQSGLMLANQPVTVRYNSKTIKPIVEMILQGFGETIHYTVTPRTSSRDGQVIGFQVKITTNPELRFRDHRPRVQDGSISPGCASTAFRYTVRYLVQLGAKLPEPIPPRNPEPIGVGRTLPG